ncbi:MAG: S41 family peptidase [Candidatus Eisenbacteria bacterium]
MSNHAWLRAVIRMRIHLPAAGLGLLTFWLLLPACTSHPQVPNVTAEQHELNLKSFEEVWTTIRDRHWDPDLGGIDWQAVHDELRPQAETATTMAAARGVMEEMIARLGKSHYGIIPQELYDDVDQAAGGGHGDGEPGFEVRAIDGHALVVSVEPGSPATLRGVRMGWEILKIGEEDIPERLKSLGERFTGKTTSTYIQSMAVSSRLAGPVADSVSVRFLDEHDQTRDLAIPLIEPQGNRVGLGNLPAHHVWFERLKLGEDIGYIAFNIFLDPITVMEGFNSAMEWFLEVPGVIIDLRGNPGGIGAMAMGMAGWLIENAGERLGTMHTRETELKFAVSPRPQVYTGRVAVLVDGLSASTSEILAGGLQDLGRARLFGTRTAGAALPSIITRLPNGDGFQYAIANYISAGGRVLEGEGITPDMEVPVTRAGLLAGHDEALEAAVAWISATP